MPVPERLTMCGDPAALSLTVKEPVREPTADGENVTVIVQSEAAARVTPQLLVWVKSPLAATKFIVSEALPVLVRVIGRVVLLLPTLTDVEKVSGLGES